MAPFRSMRPIVADGLGLALPLFRKEMRAGRITSLSERGVDADRGRHRLTFFSTHRRFRLVVDASGAIVQRSALDFGEAPLPNRCASPADEVRPSAPSWISVRIAIKFRRLLSYLLKHDLFGKLGTHFPDHALGPKRFRRRGGRASRRPVSSRQPRAAVAVETLATPRLPFRLHAIQRFAIRLGVRFSLPSPSAFALALSWPSPAFPPFSAPSAPPSPSGEVFRRAPRRASSCASFRRPRICSRSASDRL